MGRQEELAELYALAQRTRGNSNNISPRLRDLLTRFTVWSRLGTQHKGAVLAALAFGAALDENGKLVLNDAALRDRLWRTGALRFLFSRQELVSPLTRDIRTLFRSFVHRQKMVVKRQDWAGPRALTARGEHGRTGRWPH